MSKSDAKRSKDDKVKAKKQGAKKTKVTFESVLNRDEAVSYLEAIVTGLKQGVVHFKRGDDNLVMRPSGEVDLEVVLRKSIRQS